MTSDIIKIANLVCVHYCDNVYSSSSLFCSVSLIVFCFYVITGITNHEEYSLVRELPDDEKEKTLTLRRDRSIAKDQKKLDELKKKLHTDDECEFFYVAIFNVIK